MIVTYLRRKDVENGPGRAVLIAMEAMDRPPTRADLAIATDLTTGVVLTALRKCREADLVVRVRTALQTQYQLTEDGYTYARQWRDEDAARS